MNSDYRHINWSVETNSSISIYHPFFIVIILICETGYEALQSLTAVIQKRIKEASTTNLECRRLKCLMLDISRVPNLSAKGYFFISKGTLVSMLSVRNVIINQSEHF